MISFTDFDLLPTLQASLAEKNFTAPTEIQARAIPLILAGKTMVGVSETGSGKTLAFALPILHMLKTLENDGDSVKMDSQPRAVIVVPTRELGEQVSKVFKPFTHTTRLRVRTILGGTTLDVAKRNILGPCEILVATPGRLVKLLDRRLVSLNDVRILVFDEADQMLDQGFMPAAQQIVAACPAKRQMIMFSATVSAAVQALMTNLFHGAEVIRSEGAHRLVPSLVTKNIDVMNGKRFPLLETLLGNKVKGGTIIFTNTKDQCDKLASEMKKAGQTCAVYRGEMDKVERRSNLKLFRDGKIDFLISTDLASRGLDLETVGRVINYHLPNEMENYIHRAGRTARAGRKGLVVNFVTERDLPLVERLDSIKAKRAN